MPKVLQCITEVETWFLVLFLLSSSPSETPPGTSFGLRSACLLIYVSAGPSPPDAPEHLVSGPPALAGWLSLCPGHSASPDENELKERGA